MGRIRTIKPECPQSENLGRVSRDARLLFFMLFTIADDEGRGRGNARMLASLLFPYDDDAPQYIPEWLMELEREKAILVYHVEENIYFQIIKWTDHQKIDHPTKSKLPTPPTAKKRRERSPDPREPSRNLALDQGREGKGEEGIKEEGSTAPSALVPPAIALPTNRFSKLGEEVGISHAQISDYAQTFPAVDVPQQLREMRRWLVDNPERRKTAKGIPKFVNRWLSKEQDKGAGNGQKKSNGSSHDRFLSAGLSLVRQFEGAAERIDFDDDAPQAGRALLPP